MVCEAGRLSPADLIIFERFAGGGWKYFAVRLFRGVGVWQDIPREHFLFRVTASECKLSSSSLLSFSLFEPF